MNNTHKTLPESIRCGIHIILVSTGKLISSLFDLLSTQIEKNKILVQNQLAEKNQKMVKAKYDYFQYGILTDLFAVLFHKQYPNLDINSIEEIRPVESPDQYHFIFKLPVTGTARDFQLQELKSNIQQDIYRFQQKLLQEYGNDAYQLYPYIMNGLYVVDLRLSSPDYFRITLSANIFY